MYVCTYTGGQRVHPLSYPFFCRNVYQLFFTTNKLCIRSLSVFGFLMKFRIVCRLLLSAFDSWQQSENE